MRLTPAEARVLALLPTHLTAPQIAAELGRSSSTVRSQITAVYLKLGAHSRAEAVAQARSLGLLSWAGPQRQAGQDPGVGPGLLGSG